MFELAVTIAAVGELLLFIGVTAPHFQVANLARDALPHGWVGAFACLPFAIWFYLGIEGIANAAEEARNPQRDVRIGFSSAMLTLVVLAVGVFASSIGVAGWEAIVYPTPGAAASDSPLPLAMGRVVGNSGALYHLLVTVGLFGLVASFHGILLAASRATFQLGRTGYAPRFLGRIHPRTGTPVAALLVNLAIGTVAILSARTGGADRAVDDRRRHALRALDGGAVRPAPARARAAPPGARRGLPAVSSRGVGPVGAFDRGARVVQPGRRGRLRRDPGRRRRLLAVPRHPLTSLRRS